MLPTSRLSEAGIAADLIEPVPDLPVTRPQTPARFTPPFLLIKEHEDLHHDLWESSYLTYRNEIVGIAAPFDDLGSGPL